MLNPEHDRMSFYRSVILRPIVTEKSMSDASALRKYHFRVHPDANKIQVREAVEKLFHVRVVAVNTLNVRGKARQRSARHKAGRTESWTKAIVTVAPGESIAAFEIV